jgi:hypothetical protein
MQNSRQVPLLLRNKRRFSLAAYASVGLLLSIVRLVQNVAGCGASASCNRPNHASAACTVMRLRRF